MAAEIEYPLAGSAVGNSFSAGGDYTRAMTKPPDNAGPAGAAKIRCKIDIPTAGVFNLISTDWEIPAMGPCLWSVNFSAPPNVFYANRTIKAYFVAANGAEQPLPDDTVAGVNVGTPTPGDPAPGGTVIALPPP